MKALLRFATAATAAWLLLAPVTVAAQQTITPAPEGAEAVGPAQLRNFSLEGTVVRRAEPAPARSQPAPQRERPAATTSTQRTQPAPARTEQARRAPEPQPQRRADAAAAETAPAAQPSGTAGSLMTDLPPPSPADPLFSPAPVLPGPAEFSGDGSSGSGVVEDGGGFPVLPWLIAALLFAGAAAYYFRRQRSALAVAGGASELVATAPRPERLQPRPVPAPPRAAAPAGLVSTRLRPTLELHFAPSRLLLEADRAIVEFDLVVMNSGSGPARDVLIEAAIVNAGPDQDQLLAGFFARPPTSSETIPGILPLKRMAFRSSVTMARDQMREFRTGERTVFVPIVALKARYRWSAGEAQHSASFLIGRDTNGEKLAPFRTDQGPRQFGGLGKRQIEVGVAKEAATLS